MMKSKGKGQFSDDNECRSIENALHIHEVLSLSYLSLCFSSTLFVATVSQELEGLGFFSPSFFLYLWTIWTVLRSWGNEQARGTTVKEETQDDGNQVEAEDRRGWDREAHGELERIHKTMICLGTTQIQGDVRSCSYITCQKEWVHCANL